MIHNWVREGNGGRRAREGGRGKSEWGRWWREGEERGEGREEVRERGREKRERKRDGEENYVSCHYQTPLEMYKNRYDTQVCIPTDSLHHSPQKVQNHTILFLRCQTEITVCLIHVTVCTWSVCGNVPDCIDVHSDMYTVWNIATYWPALSSPPKAPNHHRTS